MITLEFLDINHSPLQIRGAFVYFTGFFPVKLHVFCHCTFYFCYFIKIICFHQILQKMARCEKWSLGYFDNEFKSFTNARYAIMYRYIVRQHCEILQDVSIPDILNSDSLYPSECTCCLCRAHFSIIAANSTIDSSDSLFALSNGWSDDDIIIQTESDGQMSSSSNYKSYSDTTDLARGTEEIDHPPLDELSYRYDEFDSQWQSDLEDPFEPEHVESDGPSFSDAETQCPTHLQDVQPSCELAGVSLSDAETQRSTDYTFVPIPFLRLTSEQDRETDSDSSSHSVRLLKRKK
jgi:hypothetical protein